jgi:hypothetical protein
MGNRQSSAKVSDVRQATKEIKPTLQDAIREIPPNKQVGSPACAYPESYQTIESILERIIPLKPPK